MKCHASERYEMNPSRRYSVGPIVFHSIIKSLRTVSTRETIGVHNERFLLTLRYSTIDICRKGNGTLELLGVRFTLNLAGRYLTSLARLPSSSVANGSLDQ
jgi:hypothetical protein